MKDYRELFLKCVTEDCILCVPRSGSVSRYMLAFEDFCAHILVPSYELPESHFLNINGEVVRIHNRVITVEHELGHQSSIHILFEETFYTDDDFKYKVLCIEKPIESKKIISCNANRIVILRTLRECVDFLWMESGSSEIVEKINHLTTEFLKTNCDDCDLETLIENTKSLYVKCVQVALKCPKMRQRVESEKSLVTNIKIAVETCMQHNIYSRIIKAISTVTAFDDAHMNKILRNLSSLQIQDFEIKSELYNAVPNAKFELSKIDCYSTVLGKSGCLKKMFLALSKCSNGDQVVSADDVLQILIFLIIKIGLPNWNAQLKYLKYFRFSVQPQIHDEVCFLITSLEAALEHIQSEMLVDENGIIKNEMSEVKWLPDKMCHYETDELGSVHNFFKAVSLGDLEQVKLCLSKEDNSMNDMYLKLCHPLCICPKCKALTSKHRDNILTVNSCDGQGLTALHIASLYCKSAIVEFLLSVGADPNKCDLNGLSAMHYAAMKGHQNGLLLIAYSGGDVNAMDYSLNTPLHYCSNNGHENCVKALIYFCENSGIKLNVNSQNSSGDTALHKASRWGYFNIVQILVENGADPTIRNKRKLSPIDEAHNPRILDLITRPIGKIQNYVRIIPFRPMLDHQEEVFKGVVPSNIDQVKRVEKLMKTIADGDSNLACYYLGLDMAELENVDGKMGECSDVESAERKCHPLCRCSDCEHSSSDDNQEETQKRQKTDRININSCNAEGYTALHMTAVHGRTELCKVIIRNGGLLNAQTREELLTPLMLACQNQRLEIVKLLLKHGCNIDMQDSEGNTALHHACRTRDTKIVSALVENDPDINIKNYRNKTALQEAEENLFIGVTKAIKRDNSLAWLDEPNNQDGNNDPSDRLD
ncbi:UNVERIFIED_CONTAM: hypothetical protein PYX00_000375 [Menopon gallinae]|uniref:VPS9 domain-containing protein n=1 Tax=Menopon gallinae TaxID=328185 RepID=A0AAW2IA42_9NEOP